MSGEQPEGYPYIRRVGAYAFFAWLSVCSAAFANAVLFKLGFPGRDSTFGDIVSYAVIVATFLALRDMTTHHDRRQS